MDMGYFISVTLEGFGGLRLDKLAFAIFLPPVQQKKELQSLSCSVSVIGTDHFSSFSRITVKGNSYCFDPETSDSCSPLPLGEAGYYVLNLNSIARAASFHTTLTTDTDVRLQFRVYTGGKYSTLQGENFLWNLNFTILPLRNLLHFNSANP